MGYGVMAYSFQVKNLEDVFHLTTKGETDNDCDDDNDGNSNNNICLDVEGIEKYIAKLRLSCRRQGQIDVLRSYFDGTITNDDDGSELWYGIEKFIDNYGGKFLPNDEWYPSSNDPIFWYINCAKLYGLNVTKKTINGPVTVRLPSPDDFPTVWIIRNVDLDTAINEYNLAANDNDNDDGNKTTTEMKNQFLKWIESCKSSGTDLVLYYY